MPGLGKAVRCLHQSRGGFDQMCRAFHRSRANSIKSGVVRSDLGGRTKDGVQNKTQGVVKRRGSEGNEKASCRF